MADREWQEEWDRLVDERAAARRRWARARDVVSEKARDPLGIKTVFKRHPVLAGGVAAGLGALLVKSILGTGRRPRAPDADRAPAPWSVALKQVAMSVATPLLTQLLQRGLERLASRAQAHVPDDEAVELNGRGATSPRP